MLMKEKMNLEVATAGDTSIWLSSEQKVWVELNVCFIRSKNQTLVMECIMSSFQFKHFALKRHVEVLF